MSRKKKKRFFSGNNFSYGFSFKPRKLENVEFILPINLYNKMLAYAQCSPGEISGFGKIKSEFKDNKEIVTILDVKIFKQKCTSGHTTLEEDALAKWCVDLIRNGEDPNEWKLWWHSHFNFGVFFSATDTGTISKLTTDLTWYSLCINQKGDMIARKDSKHGHDGDLDIVIDTSNSTGTFNFDQIKQEVNDLVSIEVFPINNIGVIPYAEADFFDGHVPEAAGDHSPVQIQKSNYYLDRVRRDRQFRGVTTW